MTISLSNRRNYQYWRDNGEIWWTEYQRRRENQAFYSLQELMIASYFAYSSPATVLEFGCGTGRHLEYLQKIPGICVYGYDQSLSMLKGITQWADPDWSKTHICLGSPMGTLPYPDKVFDIVFTAEVLIHVNPEDLGIILSELVRVSRWQVIHFEPSPDSVIVSDAHEGCWNHDLLNAYAQLGYRCQILNQGYQEQAPYRVILDENKEAYQWPDILLFLMLRAEEAWERGRAELKYKIENSEREISILIHQLQNEIDLRSEETRKRILLTQQLDEVNQHLSEYLKKISSFEQQLSEERKRTEDITTQLNLLRSENQVLKEAIKRYQIFESELSSLLSAKP